MNPKEQMLQEHLVNVVGRRDMHVGTVYSAGYVSALSGPGERNSNDIEIMIETMPGSLRHTLHATVRQVGPGSSGSLTLDTTHRN